ncbi:MAG: hypothetical protein U0S50_06870 [Sphingopyxis sp.]|uniref:hypothetical protein n=1 Tax=Sphingopyxis sp. TaxID=1908224 RepID=UPI002ABC9354|nr:hypothetical protein [Sphingopyxis sp.]MDZ3831523.1 hypothetical protein [Sphingopyxis sp.]
MNESLAPSGIDLPSPTLTARLRELAGFFAAPASGRLTEEQRALSLGVARRLVVEVAGRLDPAIDATMLWSDWMRRGLPGADQLSAHCFARVEEQRWRDLSAQRGDPAPADAEEADAVAPDKAPDAAISILDDAHLVLQIADRRRFDAQGHPALAPADLDAGLFRALLHDVAAWRLEQLSGSKALAAGLGDAVRSAMSAQAREKGIDDAARAYHDLLVAEGRLNEAAATAAARHNWPTLIGLAAAASNRCYQEMALSLLTAEAAALPSLLAPLRLDSAAIAPVEASLALLPARAVSEESGG